MKIDLYGVQAQAAKDWASKPELRYEFGGEFARYQAFTVANARGLVGKLGAGAVVRIGRAEALSARKAAAAAPSATGPVALRRLPTGRDIPGLRVQGRTR